MPKKTPLNAIKGAPVTRSQVKLLRERVYYVALKTRQAELGNPVIEESIAGFLAALGIDVQGFNLEKEYIEEWRKLLKRE